MPLSSDTENAVPCAGEPQHMGADFEGLTPLLLTPVPLARQSGIHSK